MDSFCPLGGSLYKLCLIALKLSVANFVVIFYNMFILPVVEAVLITEAGC